MTRREALFVCRLFAGDGRLLAAMRLNARTAGEALREAEHLDRNSHSAVVSYEVWEGDELLRRALSQHRPPLGIG